MSNIRQSKLDLLISAYAQGEEITSENAQTILGIKTPAVVKNYLDAFASWQKEQEGAGDPEDEPTVETPQPKAKKTFAKKQPEKLDLSNYRVVLEDENGAELDEEFEVVATTSNTIIVREVKPIIKTPTINGKQVRVDLRELRRLSPDVIYQGVKVSTLLIAAEIA